jgi:hypothetical protein
MPTVLREKGYKVYIYSHDHPPPHCHFVKSGEVAVVELSPVVRITHYSKGLKSELKTIQEIAEENQAMLLEAWQEIAEKKGENG